jgi:hypothetical protein
MKLTAFGIGILQIYADALKSLSYITQRQNAIL